MSVSLQNRSVKCAQQQCPVPLIKTTMCSIPWTFPYLDSLLRLADCPATHRNRDDDNRGKKWIGYHQAAMSYRSIDGCAEEKLTAIILQFVWSLRTHAHSLYDCAHHKSDKITENELPRGWAVYHRQESARWQFCNWDKSKNLQQIASYQELAFNPQRFSWAVDRFFITVIRSNNLKGKYPSFLSDRHTEHQRWWEGFFWATNLREWHWTCNVELLFQNWFPFPFIASTSTS